jgi:modified peptide precursor CbpA
MQNNPKEEEQKMKKLKDEKAKEMEKKAGKRIEKKDVIASRKACDASGTGLSHYILMDKKAK